MDFIEHHESGESQSPFSCEPLDRINPLDFYAFTKNYSGDVLLWRKSCQSGFHKNIKQSVK